MAITNAQQAKQIMNEGEPMEDIGFSIVKPSKNGKRPGYRSAAYQSARSNANKSSNKTSNKTSTTSSSNNNDDNRQTYNVDKKTVKTGPKPTDTRTLKSDDYDRGQSNFREQFNDYSGGARMLDSNYSTFSQRNNQKYQNRIFNQARSNIIEQLKQAGLLTDEDDKMTVEQLRDKFQVTDDADGGADYGNRSLNLDELTGIKSIQDYVDEGFYKKGGDFDNDPNNPNYKKDRIPGPFKPSGLPTLDLLGKIMAGPLTQEYLTKQFNNLEDIGSIPFDYNRDTSINALMEEYEPNRFKLQNSPRETGPSQQTDPCKGPNPPAYCAVNNDPADPATPSRNLGGLAPRFAGSIFDFTGLANGGRAGAMDGGRMMMDDDPTGGIMDLESGRQMYFLGKLVKKATKAVKKITKSKIGKAALLGAVGYGLGGGTFFGKMLPGVTRGGQGFGGFGGLSSIFGNVGDMLGGASLGDKFAKFGGSKFMKYAGVPTALALLMGQKEDDDKFNIDDYYKTNRLNIADVRNNPYNYLSAANQGSMYAADGGLMRTGYAEGSKEPVAKKTMPLLDMDGQEMDLREEGGFVPLGRMERADDVPARLSKNEFVFTADAVRNAGEGDVDKGAEVMYNMMKNLESGGEVSEESQGLDGAREMFKTSQRLEEVI